MSISKIIATAVAEAALPDQCKACERHGLPILPLRQALVPDTRPAWIADDAPPVPGTMVGLRTLRSGYLYVLLDESIWHAYEVTEQGHLRRFDPYEPRFSTPPPLPNKCVNADHDIPSAFFNVDTDRYSTAWIAFSSDPWPVSVLIDYSTAKASSDRFQVLDLAQARDNPGDIGLAMTPDQLQVDDQVFEYNQQLAGPFDSAHGFHSRLLRKTALRGFVGNAMAKHELTRGVPAVILHDTVGLIQEYNHQRLSWIVKRQAWREDPQRAYQLQTSQILQIIRATHREWAEQKVPPVAAPLTGDGPPVFVDPETERQRIVEMRQQESDARLEERYDEPRRAAFQLEYDNQEARFQWHIDHHAKNYAALCESAAFEIIEQYDYDGRDRDSGVAYSKTMAACLAGGITEALRPDPEPGPPVPGSTEALWLKWLRDPNSPAYRAVFLRDQALLAALLPSFSHNEPVQWNDSDKLYATLTKLIASEDLGPHLRNPLKQAVSETQGALNAATQRLQAQLTPGIQHAVLRLNTASQLLYNGVHLIELRVPMKLGEYYALQCAHVREVQQKANEAMAKARDRVMPSLDEMMAGAQGGMRKVRPIIQTGLLSLAVLDPKIANTVINVSVWVEGKAHVLREQLLREVHLNINQLGNAAQLGLVNISVAAGTLEASAAKILNGIRVNTQQASHLVRTSFAGLKGMATSWELLLSLGGLYLLNSSLQKNIKEAESQIGRNSGEVSAALYGSALGIIAGGTELVGLALKAGTNAATATSMPGHSNNGKLLKLEKAGMGVARTGAIATAALGIFDIAQTGLASKRSFLSGDRFAAAAFLASSLLYVAGTAVSVLAVFHPLVLGPAGIAIILSLVAFSLKTKAVEERSSALESWARRCHFGKANETPRIHWDNHLEADIAFAELNAATLGIRAQAKFQSTKTNTPSNSRIGGLINFTIKQSLNFRISIPNYNPMQSSYDWKLSFHRADDGEFPRFHSGEYIAEETQSLSLATRKTQILPKDFSSPNKPNKPDNPDYLKDSIKIEKRHNVSSHSDSDTNHLEITGTIELIPTLSQHNIIAATLSLTYWPEKSSPNAYAEIVLVEQNQ
ncbi:T6SS effector BTH_I2691 family protein [Pseudomonas putida]|uniref:T6SS effector BTH_I2691 family protein n=1 Tax=Pseudomonas putida TaxID=303 RepID=UPI001404E428|nr:T6SS effector BTH_I2691 family protein [Pseudomonas putida]